MKRTLLSLLIAGVFAGAGTSAIAQNVTAEDQAAASQTNPSTDSAAGQAKSEDDSGTSTGGQAQSDDDSTNTGEIPHESWAQSDDDSTSTGDQAANQEGMTAPEDGAAATGTDKKRQTGQAGSQDGMTSDDRAEANPEEQDPDRTAATESAAPSSQF